MMWVISIGLLIISIGLLIILYMLYELIGCFEGEKWE